MLINGRAANAVDAADRGLSYGDGLFETIRFEMGQAPLWSGHMQRLRRGCERLQLPAPDPDLLLREARQLAGDAASVVRITWTRGVGERGYAFHADAAATRIVAAFPLPTLPAALYRDGLRLFRCSLQLSAQPRLAGLKHLNRLEQVLARGEWRDPAFGEGLLCDQQGHAICATAANLFAVIDGELVTPALDQCGVAGVAREAMLAAMPQASVHPISLAECLAASELCLTSSVRGIVPVQAIGDTVYAPGPITRVMQGHWRALGFSMEQA